MAIQGALAAVVLAAGAGRRFGGNKLVAPLRGRPLIVHALEIARAAPVQRMILVAAKAQELGATGFVQVSPAGPLLSDSLKAGIAAADGCGGALIFLGDMPLVPHDMAARLVAAIGDAQAAYPTVAERPGHPVLLAASGFPLVELAQGDRGLGPVLAHRDDAIRLPVSDTGVLADVDVPSDLAALERNQG